MAKAILFWITLPICMAIGLFHIKHEVQKLEEQLKSIQHKILATEESIVVTQAEWVHLTAPQRLSQLNQKHLHLNPTEPHHILQISALNNLTLKQAALRP